MNPVTFHTVVGICSALFTPDYPVEDTIHKGQACQVFQEYCGEARRQNDCPASYEQPEVSYQSRGSRRKIQRREP